MLISKQRGGNVGFSFDAKIRDIAGVSGWPQVDPGWQLGAI